MDNYSYIFDIIKKIVISSGEPCEGNVFFEHLTTNEREELLPKQHNLSSLGKNANNILEIGFNAGHSSLLFLLANPYSKLVCFDICSHSYTIPCYEYIRSLFPGRIELIIGNSLDTIPKYLEANPTIQFDLIHIDGYHEYNHVKQEIINVLPLVDPRYNRIILNDDNFPHLYKLHREFIYLGLFKEVNDDILVPTKVFKHLIVELKIPIVTTTSKNYKNVFDIFKKSLKLQDNKNLTLMINNINLSKYNNFGFRTDSWYKALEEKIIFLYNVINLKAYENRYIIFTDADIQYFQPNKLGLLIFEAKSLNLDYYGMQEEDRNEYNTGFFIIKCNDLMKAFIKTVMDNMINNSKSIYGEDQVQINNLIYNFKFNDRMINHKMIPAKYVVWGRSTLPTIDSIFHHAVCTANTESKIEQMNYIAYHANLIGL